MRLFTPRNPKSPWSRINKEKVARLVDEGRMTSSGMRLVEGAKGGRFVECLRRDRGPGDTAGFGVGVGGECLRRGVFRGLPRLVEEEHSLVDKVGAKAGDAGHANCEDGGDGGGEPDGESSGRDATRDRCDGRARVR